MNVNKKFLVIFLLFALNLYLFANEVNLNKFARDYIRSSLILNYYSNESNQSDLGFDLIYPQKGYKYVIEINEFENEYVKQFENLTFYQFEFDFFYTSIPEKWNSRLGKKSFTLLDFKKSYSPNSVYWTAHKEINFLHNKGLIIESDEGDLYIVNNYYKHSDITTVQKDSFNQDTIKDVINLVYFHYSPSEITVNVEDSEFNFYSNKLDRYFNGKLIFETVSNHYEFKLENGVLIFD